MIFKVMINGSVEYSVKHTTGLKQMVIQPVYYQDVAPYKHQCPYDHGLIMIRAIKESNF